MSNLVIISASVNNQDKSSNRVRTDKLRRILSELHYCHGCFFSFKGVEGIYKGSSEQSFIVILRSDHIEEEISMLKGLAFNMFNQESVLVKDNKNKAKLVFKDDSEQSLGDFIEIKKEELKNYDNYTILSNNGKDTYYSIKVDGN